MKSYTGFQLPPNSMTLDDLERQNTGFTDFFRDIGLRKSLSFTRRRHRRQRHTRLWPKCTMVPMGRVQMICDFRNYNYWTGNAIGFRASRELCSNFLLFCSTTFIFLIFTNTVDFLFILSILELRIFVVSCCILLLALFMIEIYAF